MFKGYRDGKFAVGLVLGICLALFAVLLTDPPNSNASDAVGYSTSHKDVDEEKNHNAKDSAFWHWDGRLVTSSDTLAQWVMTAFTIVAAGLLLGTLIVARRTLVATQDMASETTRIGEAQVRSYIDVTEIGFIFKDKHAAIQITMKNTGQSPCRDMQICLAVKIDGWRDSEIGADDTDNLRVYEHYFGMDVPDLGSGQVHSTEVWTLPQHLERWPDFPDHARSVEIAAVLSGKDVFGKVVSETSGWQNRYYNFVPVPTEQAIKLSREDSILPFMRLNKLDTWRRHKEA